MAGSIFNFEVFYKLMKFEEKKGKLKKDYYSSNVVGKLNELRETRKEYRLAKNEQERLNLKYDIAVLREELDEIRRSELKEIFGKIEKDKFEIRLQRSIANEKEVFEASNLETMLICKFIMQDIKTSYRQYPANRNDVVEELKVLLNDNMSKLLIRTDIYHFFESIPQRVILDKLINDAFLSKESIKNLKRIFYQYNELSNNDKAVGIPRGICFSSYLAEIYLKEIDKEIVNLDGVYFYKRYVDDIVILINSKKKLESYYWKKLDEIFEKRELQLNRHEEKSFAIMLNDNAILENKTFTYLGYKFLFAKNKVELTLSDEKFERYKVLIDAIFDIYKKCATYRSYKKNRDITLRKEDALKQMMNRLNVLTGNGLLNGRKNYVAVGVFYSNKMLTTMDRLRELDEYLYSCLDNEKKFNPPSNLFQYGYKASYNDCITKLKEKVRTFYSFEKGFRERRMYKGKDYQLIVKALKYIYISRV